MLSVELMDNDNFIYFRAMFNLIKVTMKKIIVFAVICLTTLSSIDAQSFVSGSFSYSSTSGEETNNSNSEDLPSTSSFELLPRYGYQVNDKWALGVGLGYMTQKTTQYNNDYYNNTRNTEISKFNMIVIAPFVRLTFAKLNKFSFMAEGELAFGFGDSELTVDGSNVANPDISLKSLSIAPVIKYDINDRWAIESTVKIFGISYSSYKQSEDNYEASNNSFDFGAGTDLGAISLGAIYKF